MIRAAASDLPLHSGVHIAKTRSRTAASVVESSRREDAGDEHLRYSPSSGSLANVSTSAPVVSGETPEGTNGAGALHVHDTCFVVAD